MSNDNYCRNTETGEYVCFTGELPPLKGHTSQWAFWRIPTGLDPVRFTGKLIGEDPDERSKRMRFVREVGE